MPTETATIFTQHCLKMGQGQKLVRFQCQIDDHGQKKGELQDCTMAAVAADGGGGADADAGGLV